MFNLTRQERFVLLFIGSAALSGICINYLLKNNPRFKNFLPEASIEAASYSKINLNKATLEELINLPGVGPELAGRILAYRSKVSEFKAIEDIRKVKGIGVHKFESLKDRVSIE